MARIWKGGCIIRARFLDEIMQACSRNADLSYLLSDAELAAQVREAMPALRRVVQLGAAAGAPLPGLGSALAYIDTYAASSLPQNLVQAQRDFFGAHTYRRADRDGVFHTEWEEPSSNKN